VVKTLSANLLKQILTLCALVSAFLGLQRFLADAAKKFVGHVPSMPVANHGMQLVERAAVLRASRKKLNQSFHRVEHDRWRRAKRPYQRPGSAAPRHGWT